MLPWLLSMDLTGCLLVDPGPTQGQGLGATAVILLKLLVTAEIQAPQFQGRSPSTTKPSNAFWVSSEQF